MNIDELLGIDSSDPLQQQADAIVEAQHRLLDDLRAHRERSGLTVAQVAERMGLPDEAVREIEGYRGMDARLSTLRLYTLAIGASVAFTVTSTTNSEAS